MNPSNRSARSIPARAVINVASGMARCNSTGSASAPRPQSRAAIGSGNHTSSWADPPSTSTQRPSRHSRPGWECNRRRCWAHAGPPTPTIAACTSVTRSSAAAAWRASTHDRPGENAAPATTVTPAAVGLGVEGQQAVDLVDVVGARHHGAAAPDVVARRGHMGARRLRPGPRHRVPVRRRGPTDGPSVRASPRSGSAVRDRVDRTITVRTSGDSTSARAMRVPDGAHADQPDAESQIARRHAPLNGARRRTTRASHRSEVAVPRSRGSGSPARRDRRGAAPPSLVAAWPSCAVSRGRRPGSGQWG